MDFWCHYPSAIPQQHRLLSGYRVLPSMLVLYFDQPLSLGPCHDINQSSRCLTVSCDSCPVCAVSCYARSRTIWRIRRNRIRPTLEDPLLAWRSYARQDVRENEGRHGLGRGLCHVLRQLLLYFEEISQATYLVRRFVFVLRMAPILDIAGGTLNGCFPPSMVASEFFSDNASPTVDDLSYVRLNQSIDFTLILDDWNT